MGERTYLDFNATAPLRPEALEAVLRASPLAGNASSVHAEGRAARRLIENARERVAALVGALPSAVVFTSGGTEANNWALSPATRRAERGAETRLCLISAVEHASVRSGHRFHPALVGEIPVMSDGVVDLAEFTRLVEEAEHEAPGASILISVMLANNETGVLQPVAEIAALARSRGHIVHCDAVQAAGKLPIDIVALGVDLMTLSGHKLGAPQGVGALVFGGDRLALDPILRGGGQERARRAGTENLPGIAGFAAAATLAMSNDGEIARISVLRDSLERALRIISPEAVFYGEAAARLPNTTCFTIPGMSAETAVIAFDLAGIAVSSGSACSSGKVAPSHVLAAMGASPEAARGAVRISLGWATTEADIERFGSAWKHIHGGMASRREGRSGPAHVEAASESF